MFRRFDRRRPYAFPIYLSILVTLIGLGVSHYLHKNSSPINIDSHYVQELEAIKKNLLNTSAAPFDLEQHLQQYQQLKQHIKSHPPRSQQQLFTYVNDSLTPYWMGTPWDFNGVTQEPRKGHIACGYFVTTVLRDAGISLKRVYLAQQASSVMIKQLSQKGSVKRYASIPQLEKYLAQYGENELFIVGLDFHTGFIIKEKGKSYFVHSSYADRVGVVREPVDNSAVLSASKSFMVGRLNPY